MNRKETIDKIYNTLIEQGKTTSKADTLGVDPMEDKVYSKQLSVNKNIGEGPDAIELVGVTVTSCNMQFRDTSPADIRINTKNVKDQWCNIFVNEATDEMLALVESAIG